MDAFFFDNWWGFWRTLIVGILAYVSIVFLLRISGKRTLSQWNAFDFIVTVALGSTLATAILSQDVPLLEGIIGFSVLIFLQLIVTWLSVRSPFIRRAIKAKPTLLLYEGRYLYDQMKKERVSESEIRAALRGQGLGSADRVAAVVLETDGHFSVIHTFEGADSTLQDVAGLETISRKRD